MKPTAAVSVAAVGGTRERILDLALNLLARRGYNGFSYRDIAQALGVRNAAIHYHYTTKADLGVALIRRYRDLLARRTRRFMEEGGDPRSQLEGYIAYCRQETQDLERVCPVSMLAADYFGLPQEMRAEAARLAQELIRWMSRVLELGRDQGVFRFYGPAEPKAIAALTSLQGARALSRFAGAVTLDAAIDQLHRDLGIEAPAD